MKLLKIKPNFLTILKKLFFDENAQGLTEYALLIALIAIALAITAIIFRNQVSNVFNNITNNMEPAVNAVDN